MRRRSWDLQLHVAYDEITDEVIVAVTSREEGRKRHQHFMRVGRTGVSESEIEVIADILETQAGMWCRTIRPTQKPMF